MNLPEKDVSFARDIFLEYKGDRYFMASDNLLDMYRQFKISDEQEYFWAYQEESKLLRVFVCRDLFYYPETISLFAYLARYPSFEILSQVNAFLEPRTTEMCTFTKILFSKKLLTIYYSTISACMLLKPLKLRTLLHTKKIARAILRSASQQEIRVDDRYRKWPGFHESDFSEERLRERIRSASVEIQKSI